MRLSMQVIEVSKKLEKIEEKRQKLKKKRSDALRKSSSHSMRSKTKRTKKARRGRRNRVLFSDTALGRLLLTSAPLEYQMICAATQPDKVSAKYFDVVVRSVEAIAYASDNPVFREQAFRIALIEFRRYGVYPKRKKRWCTCDAVAASVSRQNQIRLQD